MVAREDHIRDLSSDLVHPLLPEIPVGLVQHAHIAALGAALVGDLASRKRHLVLRRNGEAAWKLGGRAIIADGPVVLAGQDARVPVVSVADIATVPRKGNIVVVDSLVQVLVRSSRVGVAHVVDHGNIDLAVHASGAPGGEAQDVRGGGAIRGGDLVVIRGAGLEAADLDFVEVLAALGDSRDQGAGRGAAVAGIVSYYSVI